MKQNENPESPRTGHASSGNDWWEDWDGQDSSIPEEPWEPDAIDLLLHPELAEDRAGEVGTGEGRKDPDEGAGPEGRAADRGAPAPQPATDYGLPPEVAEARRRQGLTGPPKRTGTGFFYKNGDEIPPTHPDHGPMHLIPRQQDGSFAAYYYCSKQELACMANPAPPPRRYRRDGFSPERQQIFVEHLRNTGSMTDAARLTGISRSTVYNLYNSSDAAAFRAAVDEALDATQGLLEATALERAIKGQEEIVYYQGRRVGVRWKYDNRLLMSLLRARNPLKYAPLNEIEGWLARRGIAPPADVEGALDRLAAAEAEWGRRLPGENLLSAHPEQASSEAEMRVEACPERLPQAGSRRGLPAGPALPAARPALAIEPPAHSPEALRQDPPPAVRPEPVEGQPFFALAEQEEERASTGSARTDGAENGARNNRSDASAAGEPVAEAAQASISSTSDADSPAQASNLSTFEAEPAAQASTSSTFASEPTTSAHPEQASSEAEMRVEACPERLPQAGSRRGPLQASTSSTSDADSPAQASNLSTLAPEPPAQASTSSTCEPEPPVQASNLSTLESDMPAQASTSSTLPAETPAAPAPCDAPSVFRPPPRPCIRLG